MCGHLALLVSCWAVPASVGAVEDSEAWTIRRGDFVVFDLSTNRGRLYHRGDPDPLTFAGASGQKRAVSYLGRRYYAATPIDDWMVQSTKIQPDRMTFGKSGLFLRLYRGGLSTAYGIHSYGNLGAMIGTYGSMGCLIVNDEILDILHRTYVHNGNTLRVKTVAGFDVLQEPVAWWDFMPPR
ncbi:MAG: hypothetical protein Greene041619_220 [Candidatus Peregrinibacteria bacterium Greene0416_19]|nr:MAG: hypothetical protein Greene041619_220 [Candidatus Peregrinibacteria bacterium Greene0416_19]